MADEHDPDISRKYRELGAEEPPRALDQAILAASRRAVVSRPAPLVVPAGRRRWYFPVAAAAVITLAVAVTVQVEKQKPNDEVVVASAPPQAQKEAEVLQAPSAPEQPKPAPKLQRAPQPFTPEPPPAASAPQSAEAMRDLAKSNEQASAAAGARADQAPASPPVVAQAAPPAEPARREMESPRPQAGMAARGRLESKVMETPEAWLERIGEMRKQDKHEEADKALAEFRKQHPDYRMSDETRAKVERTK